VYAGVSKLRTLNDLIAEYLTRREDLIAPKTLKIERDLLQGVLAPALGDRLLADLEPIDFGKAVADYAGRLKREGRSNGTNANKLLAAARRMFKAARGWGVVGAADPTARLTKPAKEAPPRPHSLRRGGAGWPGSARQRARPPRLRLDR
jgi:hypothetical protein